MLSPLRKSTVSSVVRVSAIIIEYETNDHVHENYDMEFGIGSIVRYTRPSLPVCNKKE